MKTNASQRLAGIAAIVLLLPLTLIPAACSGTSAAQDIVNWTPALQSAVATVDSTAALLSPAEAPIFTAATIGFDAASNFFVGQAKAYLANPSATILAQLQTQIVTFQQQVNSALLQAAKITNPASQQHALAGIQGVATIVNALVALVASISSKTAVAQMAARSTIKLAAVQRLRTNDDDAQAVFEVVAHYDMSPLIASLSIKAQTQELQASGF